MVRQNKQSPNNDMDFKIINLLQFTPSPNKMWFFYWNTTLITMYCYVSICYLIFFIWLFSSLIKLYIDIWSMIIIIFIYLLYCTHDVYHFVFIHTFLYEGTQHCLDGYVNRFDWLNIVTICVWSYIYIF